MKKYWHRLFVTIWRDIKKYRYVIIAVAVYWSVTRLLFGAYCPQLLVTGLPCAGCGMTRALYFLITGRIARAMALNPSCVVWLFLIVWVCIYRYFLFRRVPIWKGILAVAAVVTIGTYLFRMILIFPSNPPMVYRSDNLISLIIPEYRRILSLIWNRI